MVEAEAAAQPRYWLPPPAVILVEAWRYACVWPAFRCGCSRWAILGAQKGVLVSVKLATPRSAVDYVNMRARVIHSLHFTRCESGLSVYLIECQEDRR